MAKEKFGRSLTVYFIVEMLPFGDNVLEKRLLDYVIAHVIPTQVTLIQKEISLMM